MRINEQMIREIISRHGISYRESDYNKGKRLELERCPFNDSHVKSSALFINPDGSVGFKCQHDSCSAKNIVDFVAHYEPDMLKKTSTAAGAPIVPKMLSSVKEEQAEWLFRGYVPKACITLLCGDGGVGKSQMWANLVASATTGEPSILNHASIEKREPQTALFLSSEDSVSKVLVARLRMAGADMDRVLFVDPTDEAFGRINFGSDEVKSLVEAYKPALVVFDPIQAFVPPDMQMSSRNAMRQCLAPLTGLGETYGTSFILVVHTNKRLGVFGRNRIADSADLWDIARSVLIVGNADKAGKRYLSCEKHSYCGEVNTILFSINEFGLRFEGYSDKHDFDYVQAMARETRPSPARDDAKALILEYLKDGEEVPVKELDQYCTNEGVSSHTLRRAKEELKRDALILWRSEGSGKQKAHFVRINEWMDVKEDENPFSPVK